MSTITRFIVTALAAVALALPVVTMAGPDAAQQAIIQKAQQAKKDLAAAQAATGAERQKMLEAHMKLMDDIMAQM